MIDWLRLHFAQNINDKPRLENKKSRILARVVSVYDGDTFTIIMIDNRKIVKRRCRCLGYDSPEMKTKIDSEYRRAIAAKYFLQAYLPKTVFRIDTYGFDKYGRLLVDYTKKGKSLKDVMIEHGHGYEYHGGKKNQSM